MNKVKSVISFVNLCLLLLIYTNLFAVEQAAINTRADGIANIVAGNTAIARDEAINNALKKAVEHGVETIVSAEIIPIKSQLLNDNIYSKTDDYISNYRIVSEKTTGNLYQVTIEANVETIGLKNDLTALGMVTSKNNIPKVLIMVAEKNIGQHFYHFWWSGNFDQADITISELSLNQNLSDRDFDIINYSMISEERDIPDMFRVYSLANSSVQAIGNLYGADLVIYGKATARIAELKASILIKSARADVSLIAVDTSSGEVIASVKNNGWASHINTVTAGENSLMKAIDGIAKEFLSQVADNWNKETDQKTKIKMVISNIKSFANFVKFKKILQNQIPGVQTLHQRGFSGGSALLELEMKGSSQNLADELTMAEYYNGYTVDITGLTENSIKLEMRALR